MKYLLVLTIFLTLLTGCKSTGELKPVSQIAPGVAKEGSLANEKLIADAKASLETLIGGPIDDAELLKFVIQQPVGDTGSRAWREMWIVKTEQNESQYIMTFKESGLNAVDFEIKQMGGDKCPDSVDEFKAGQKNEFIQGCLGKPDHIDKNPDGRYVYFYHRPNGIILTYLFDPNDEFVRFRAYEDKS